MDIRKLTEEEFKNLGAGVIAYIKPTKYQGEDTFTVIDASGTPLIECRTIESAKLICFQNNVFVQPLQ